MNAIAPAPGYITTGNTAVLQTDAVRNQVMLDRIPVARWGDPEDLGGAAVFLASSASNYVNGHILAVTGVNSGADAARKKKYSAARRRDAFDR